MFSITISRIFPCQRFDTLFRISHTPGFDWHDDTLSTDWRRFSSVVWCVHTSLVVVGRCSYAMHLDDRPVEMRVHYRSTAMQGPGTSIGYLSLVSITRCKLFMSYAYLEILLSHLYNQALRVSYFLKPYPTYADFESFAWLLLQWRSKVIWFLDPTLLFDYTPRNATVSCYIQWFKNTVPNIRSEEPYYVL